MKHAQFVKLSIEQRAKLISQNAVEIAERSDGTNTYFLYQLDSFYIEGKYLGEDVVMIIKSFADTYELQPYISSIDIQGILS
jgi:hypothetical protein